MEKERNGVSKVDTASEPRAGRIGKEQTENGRESEEQRNAYKHSPDAPFSGLPHTLEAFNRVLLQVLVHGHIGESKPRTQFNHLKH